jgi:hypothetical protein
MCDDYNIVNEFNNIWARSKTKPIKTTIGTKLEGAIEMNLLKFECKYKVDHINSKAFVVDMCRDSSVLLYIYITIFYSMFLKMFKLIINCYSVNVNIFLFLCY